MGERRKHPINRLILFLLAISLHPPCPAQTPQGPVAPGDADGDGFVTMLDRPLILQQILGLGEATGNPDFNQDGEVDIADVAGLTESFFEAEDSVVRVEVTLSKEVVEPGGGVTLGWTIEADRDIETLQVRVRAREPGHVVTSTDAVFATPGVIPANASERWWFPARQWGSGALT